MAMGNMIGRSIKFEDWNGDTRMGTIVSILENGDYEVSTDMGNVLVKKVEIIKMRRGGGIPKATQMKRAKVAKVMREFKEGKLRSGSKRGPVVKDRDQAIAIALSEAGMSKKMGTGGVVGDKMFSVNPHSIGKAKYVIDYYDGKSTHKDGSPFIGIKTFSNKLKLQQAIKELKSEGYIEVNNVFNAINNKKSKKNYYVQYNVGKVKYLVNFHDGVKTHKDGSEFYDIETFNNQKDLKEFISELTKKGYTLRQEKGGYTWKHKMSQGGGVDLKKEDIEIIGVSRNKINEKEWASILRMARLQDTATYILKDEKGLDVKPQVQYTWYVKNKMSKRGYAGWKHKSK